ncbi:MAG: hypothetical protein ACRDYB_07420 [Acidimicrobiales bacterium]
MTSTPVPGAPRRSGTEAPGPDGATARGFGAAAVFVGIAGRFRVADFFAAAGRFVVAGFFAADGGTGFLGAGLIGAVWQNRRDPA